MQRPYRRLYLGRCRRRIYLTTKLVPTHECVGRSGKRQGSHRTKWPIVLSRVRLGVDERGGGVGHDTAIATIVGITAGNFRLVDRLLTQIERVQAVNELEMLSPRGR